MKHNTIVTSLMMLLGLLATVSCTAVTFTTCACPESTFRHGGQSAKVSGVFAGSTFPVIINGTVNATTPALIINSL